MVVTYPLLQVSLIATFNSSSFADCLAIAKEGALTIGNVEEIQKLHVRTVPLHEQARRIVHQEATKTFGVLTLGQVRCGGGVGRVQKVWGGVD